MNIVTVALSLLIFTSASMASTVAIIDSGTDYLHKDLSSQMWENLEEAPGGVNHRDEDGNGYEDDIWGWNFAESNNLVIADKYRGMLNDDIKKFFTVQEKMMKGTATIEEVVWLKAKVGDKEFIKKLSIYGNFMHGTHVGGIAVNGNPDASLLAVKLIPTEVALPGSEDKEEGEVAESVKNDETEPAPVVKEIEEGGFMDMMLKKVLASFTQQQMKLMTEIAVYVDHHKADVANGSFGTGYKQVEAIINLIFNNMLRREPTDVELKRYTHFFLNSLIAEGQKMVAAAPKTLFVFAAGNDGSDNDMYPTSPTNIKADNVISVAATLGNADLARFSNYGEKNVDVAAPGVGIYSTVPDDEYLKVSGTSQAAPYVANIAARVKDSNPDLSPAEIKKIVLGTVDLKTWLKGKVKTSGVVNKSRAMKAAELSKTMDVLEAIKVSRNEVADEKTMPILKGNKGIMDLDAHVLPLPSTLILR